MERPHVDERALKKALDALEKAGWEVTGEPGKWVDGTPCPLFKVVYPGYHQMAKGGIPLPFRKLYDFQLVEFAQEHGNKSEPPGPPVNPS